MRYVKFPHGALKLVDPYESASDASQPSPVPSGCATIAGRRLEIGYLNASRGNTSNHTLLHRTREEHHAR